MSHANNLVKQIHHLTNMIAKTIDVTPHTHSKSLNRTLNTFGPTLSKEEAEMKEHGQCKMGNPHTRESREGRIVKQRMGETSINKRPQALHYEFSNCTCASSSTEGQLYRFLQVTLKFRSRGKAT
ncbi:BAF_HP2_G0030170.mRNA.1.CDS.1 [Saccharomyces cerevisiae]|nr:BAF_HP2_G0030170.mRNA.1.CDS.1 [Saccharomyces cerevisiae]CAI6455254.1 BAF_HP2_G0030170.mRNA.1.CDS.1 [Saccharomyces cerevisiae]